MVLQNGYFIGLCANRTTMMIIIIYHKGSHEFKRHYMIYHNKQLVLLATYKPKSKKKYISLSNFTEKTWDDYGTIMVEITKNHLHESSKTT